MANRRSINSPGVEIREIDLSTRVTTPNGTSVLVAGFAPQGPTSEIVNISTIADFENIYGTPTNAAERYFYYSVRQLFTGGTNAVVNVARLPYGADSGEGFSSKYSALAFPVLPTTSSAASALSAAVYSAGETAVMTATLSADFVNSITVSISGSFYTSNPTLTFSAPQTGTNVATASASISAGVITGVTITNAGSGYSTVPTITVSAPPLSAAPKTSLSNATYYYLAKPTLVELSESDYNFIKQGGLNWAATAGSTTPTFTDVYSLSAAGLVILNDAKTTINEKFEGYYLNLADNTNLNPTTDFDDALDIKTIIESSSASSSYSTIPTTRLGFAVSATSGAGIDSLSQTIENLPTYNIATGSGYDDTAILSLFKIRTTPFEKNSLTLSYVLQEGYTASFYVNRTIQDPNGGAPLNNFIGTVVNDLSPNLSVLVNTNISNNTTWLDASGNANKYLRVLKASQAVNTGSYEGADSLFPLGVYAQTLDTTNNKVIGNVSTKLDTILNLAENTDIVNVDVVVDGGLSTIAAAVATAPLSTTGVYDDTIYSGDLKSQIDGLSDTSGAYSPGTVVSAWRDITNKFSQFTQFRRKDCVYISDPIRQVFLQGENFKTLDDKSKNFSSNIYWPLRNLYTSYNTSYSVAYGNWVKVVDGFSSKQVWVPFSGFAAAIYTNNDAVAYPWGAPAGLNRGIVTGISDIAVNPQQKQRDLLYKVSINPVVTFPNEGTTIMGQKTLLKAPSAFDRINVRRLFLYLEKSVLNTTKFFVFEPNTSFTRSRLVNTISPVFDLARNTQGVYDYLIVCNDTNNTADVIDDNTLVVDIYIKPTRTAEFILVNFYATRTNQNFQELLQ